MQTNTSKTNTFLLVLLIVLVAAVLCVMVFKNDDKLTSSTNTQSEITTTPTQPTQNTGVTPPTPKPSISTTLPQYVSAQSGWPPVIQNSATAYSCTPHTSTGDGPQPDVVQKMINGKTYCVSSMIDAAAGSRYGEYTYITANGNGTKKTTFTLRWPSCGGYGAPGNVQYDQCQANQTAFFNNLDALIDSLM